MVALLGGTDGLVAAAIGMIGAGGSTATGGAADYVAMAIQ